MNDIKKSKRILRYWLILIDISILGYWECEKGRGSEREKMATGQKGALGKSVKKIQISIFYCE